MTPPPGGARTSTARSPPVPAARGEETAELERVERLGLETPLDDLHPCAPVRGAALLPRPECRRRGAALRWRPQVPLGDGLERTMRSRTTKGAPARGAH